MAPGPGGGKREEMAENKGKQTGGEASEKSGGPGKSVEERRLRQARALRANLKKRKTRERGRAGTGDGAN